MRDDQVLNLADCTEFRQALQARPPAIVHGAAALLVALLGTAFAWAATTRANLVVRAPGRVRPTTTTVKVFNDAHGEVLGAGAGGRVVEVNFREGDAVRRGDVLIRLDTERLDNEIVKKLRAIQAAEEELEKLNLLEGLQGRQHEVSVAKAEAELAQGQEIVGRARERRDAEIRLARLALKVAEDEEVPLRKLAARGAVASQELRQAAARTREARAKSDSAQISVDEESVPVLRRALELAGRDHAVKREELELKRATKRGEGEAARIELAGLELEREHAVLYAPLDGVVTAGDIKVGDLLEPGKPVAEIARREGYLFEATVPSEEVAHLRVGLPARIKLDAYDYQRYGTLDGEVRYLSPDSGVSQEQPRATYIVRIAVHRDEFGRGAYRGRVKLGMAGQAEVVTARENLLSLLLKRIRQTISLG